MSEKRPMESYTGSIFKDQASRLKRLAKETQVSVASLVRAAIDEHLAANQRPREAPAVDPRQMTICTCPKGTRVFECPVHGAWMP